MMRILRLRAYMTLRVPCQKSDATFAKQ